VRLLRNVDAVAMASPAMAPIIVMSLFLLLAAEIIHFHNHMR